MENLSNEDWKTELDEIAKTYDAVSSSISITHTNDSTKNVKQPQQLAGYFDHTVLKLDATEQDVDQLCKEAKEYGFAAVCVRENFVAHAKALLDGTSIAIACVVGFHEGSQSTAHKIAEAQRAIRLGATELDVVLNREVLQAGDYKATFEELVSLRDDTPSEVHLKLILETSGLEKKQIVDACALAGWARWDYVKTSTGFCGHGATVEDVLLMRQMTEVMVSRIGEKTGKQASKMKVKASGGIRKYTDTLKMIRAGADRIGASAGVAIMKEASESQGVHKD